MTKINLGNSVDNIQITENVLSKEEHKQLLDYTINVNSWETQPWGVKILLSKEMPEEIINILEKIFKIAHKKCTAGDFATIYYINDDYEGGEINFMDHNLKIKPKANSFITFPSNSDYWHEVLENTVKERYSSTLWFKFVGSEMLRPELGLIR